MSLAPITSNLGVSRAKHLLRRSCFHYNKNLLYTISNLNVDEAFEVLTQDNSIAYTEPYDPKPNDNPHGYWLSSDTYPPDVPNQGRKRGLISQWWFYNMISRNNLKDKLLFFLHSNFTIANGQAGASHYFYDHLRLLNHFSEGSIKDLAKKITLDNAMLNYLDNTQNNANNPNENYAREFLELFTITKGEQIGEGDYTNYTEDDVIQAARVFSGFKTQLDRSNIDPDTEIPIGRISVNQHDQGQKIFSHAFDNYVLEGGDDEESILIELHEFVDMIFAKGATAKAYVEKLYRFFVKSEWNPEDEINIIIPLSQQLVSNNYNVLPVVKTLLSSQHFYDAGDNDPSDEIIGSIIKSPLQLISSCIRNLNFQIPDPNIDIDNYYRFSIFFLKNTYFPMTGMNLFEPETVAGYPAVYQSPDFDRLWFSSATILARYRMVECLITGRNALGQNGQFGSSIDSVLLIQEHISSPNDIYNLISDISEILYPFSIQPQRIEYFADLILDGYPSYYWTDTWNNYISSGDDTIVRNKLDLLIKSMINAAENQLM
tara:strand:+ start:19452 stop:21083 length:1632 start_codon:yes stop_codon:yes gene_type:complete